MEQYGHERESHRSGPAGHAPEGQQAENGPGLAAIERMTAGGDAGARQAAQILRAHPQERDAIMSWLHQHRGNAFVQEVTQHMGQLERAMPPGVELKSVHGSFAVPGGKKLAGNWAYSAATRETTQVRVEVSTTGIRVSLSPGLYLDVDFPGRDAELTSAGLDFATGKPYVHVGDGGGIGVIPVTGIIADKVTGIIERAVAGTPLAGRYDPGHDPDLAGTLSRVLDGFSHAFATGDAKQAGKPPIRPEEMTQVSAGATIAMHDQATFIENGTGIRIAGGAPLTIGVDGAGNLARVMATHDPQSAIDAAQISAVHLDTDGLEVVAKGEPVAKITGMTLSHGGQIKIDSMQTLGKLAHAEATEGGLSLLVALIAARAGDGNTANQAYQNAQHPAVVGGISRAMIEKTFTETLHKLILQYRTAVPGIDLAKSLGIS